MLYCGNLGQQEKGIWSYGVTVSILDSESSDRGSNPRETYLLSFECLVFVPQTEVVVQNQVLTNEF